MQENMEHVTAIVQTWKKPRKKHDACGGCMACHHHALLCRDALHQIRVHENLKGARHLPLQAACTFVQETSMHTASMYHTKNQHSQPLPVDGNSVLSNYADVDQPGSTTAAELAETSSTAK
jgi:hypothetical protein